MNLFEMVSCDLCGSNNHDILYQSKQYADSTLGKMDVSIVMCRECDFMFQNPQLTNIALENHYNMNSSGDVFRLYSENSRAALLSKERYSFIDPYIITNNIKNICDVGGGKGAFISNLLTNKKINKYLIEPSEAINQCVDNDIIKIKEFIENIPKKDIPKFDLIALNGVLEHLKKPTTALKQLCEFITYDGAILIEIPNSLKPYGTFAEFYSYEHVNHFSIQTILSLLEKCKLFPIKIEEGTSTACIRVLAKKRNCTKDIKHVFTNYTESKVKLESTIKNKIDLTLNEFAIYGAGDHTRFLLEKFDLIDKVSHFIDSDSRKWGELFYNKKIISPQEIESLHIKNILVSSHDFEHEILQTIKKNIKEKINIITLYSSH